MVRLRQIAKIAWLLVPMTGSLYAPGVYAAGSNNNRRKVRRKVLPLDHPLLGTRALADDRALQDGQSADGGATSTDGASSSAITVGGQSATGGGGGPRRNRRPRGRGGGFLGDGLNIIRGRQGSGGAGYTSADGGNDGGGGNGGASYDGNSYRSGNSRQVHPNPPNPNKDGDGPDPDDDDDQGIKSGTNTPALSPVVYHPDGHYHPDEYGKGKGKGKSKSKSKKKSKGKGKKSHKHHSHWHYHHAGETPIDGHYGADEIGGEDIWQAGTDADGGDGGGDVDNGGGGDDGGDDGGGGNGHNAGGGQEEETLINLTPFGILYDLDDGVGTPSSVDYGMVIEVTMGYLNTYMTLQYEGQNLETFETTATSTIYRDGVPQIDYEATATFLGEAPSLETLDDSVAQAFSGANLALYLSMLQNMPSENAFSTTTGARLTSPVGLDRRSSKIGISVSTVGKAGIAGAIGAGGLIIFAIGLMIYGKNGGRPRHHSVGEGGRRVNPNQGPVARKKEIQEQTVMGETTTCASSTDGTISICNVSLGKRIPSSISHRKTRNDSEEVKAEEDQSDLG